jgi:predicted PurR-regulated permease PerM
LARNNAVPRAVRPIRFVDDDTRAGPKQPAGRILLAARTSPVKLPRSMSEASTPFFSATQRRLVGIAVGLFAFILIVALIVGVVWILGQVVGMFAHVIWPLAVAGILALMLRPVVGVFERRLRMTRVASVLVLYAIVIVGLTGILLLFLPQLILQVIDFVNSVPDLWRRAGETVKLEYPGWVDLYNRAIANETLGPIITRAIEQANTLVMAALQNLAAAGGTVGGTVVGAIGFVTNLAMVPVYLFFFLQSNQEPTRNLGELMPFLKTTTRDDVVFLAREFIGIVVAFFRGQLLIGLIMGALMATGFSLCGLQFGVIFGLLAGLLNVVPYLGTILGLAAVIPTAYFQQDGGLLTLALCLGVFAVVQLIEGYLLTPRIMGRQTGLHPVTIIIAIFFWGTALDGILGMILAIPLTAFMVTAWRLGKRKYLTVRE